MNYSPVTVIAYTHSRPNLEPAYFLSQPIPPPNRRTQLLQLYGFFAYTHNDASKVRRCNGTFVINFIHSVVAYIE